MVLVFKWTENSVPKSISNFKVKGNYLITIQNIE